MQLWYELEAIANNISFFFGSSDDLIWQYKNKGVYSTSSLYSFINFGGVQPFYIPAVWHLHIPHIVHIFLWLLSHHKLITRDNRKKRNLNKPADCIFCA
jgi:hypothetical protein